jgi:hypothetical protein
VNVDPEAVIGRVLWEVFPTLIGTQFELFLRRAMNERRPAQFIERDLFHDQWLNVRVIPTAEGVCAYVNDITARVVADQQRDLLLRVGSWSANHSIRRARSTRSRAPRCRVRRLPIVDVFDRDDDPCVTGARHPRRCRADAPARPPATLDGKNFLSRCAPVARARGDAGWRDIDSLSDDPDVRDIVHALSPRSCIVVPLVADGRRSAPSCSATRAITRTFTDATSPSRSAVAPRRVTRATVRRSARRAAN